MSYEINIIAINQIEPVYFGSLRKIIVQNEKKDYGINRYAEIWPFFSYTKGILYSLVTEICEDYYSAFEICDTDFDAKIPDVYLGYYVSKEYKEKLTPFLVKEKYYEEFILILNYLLEKAPQKRILFQTRYQGGDKEIVLGVIKEEEFIDMLTNRQILFNVCYIVEK